MVYISIRNLAFQTMKKADYNQEDIHKALVSLGIQKGDIVFSHTNIAYFGIPEGGLSDDHLQKIFLDTILDIIGEEGTFIAPAFSYTFPNKGVFDINTTPTVCGSLSEITLRHPKAIRSNDPLFSVAAIGDDADTLTQNISLECFGRDSFWERFHKKNGKIVNFNIGAANTYFHYVERCLNVPYRYDKQFFCKVREHDKAVVRPTVYFCRDMSNELFECDWMGIDQLAKMKNVIQSVDVGRGYITSARARDLFKLIEKALTKAPFFLTKARNISPKPLLIKEEKKFNIGVFENGKEEPNWKALNQVPRDMISDGMSAILSSLEEGLSLKLNEFPTGSRVDDWVVPEKWTCLEGRIETLQGEEILSYKKDVSCVASYSSSFEGIVPKSELMNHLWVDEKNTEAVPDKFLYYDMDWGFCCTAKQKELLMEEQYRVTLKSEFSIGHLKIGETVLEGRGDEQIIICAHLCDEHVRGDGILSLQAGIALWQKLQQKEYLSHTYHFSIVPKVYNIATYLEHNYKNATHIKQVIVLCEDGAKGCREVFLADKLVTWSDKNINLFFSNNEGEMLKLVDQWELCEAAQK